MEQDFSPYRVRYWKANCGWTEFPSTASISRQLKNKNKLIYTSHPNLFAVSKIHTFCPISSWFWSPRKLKRKPNLPTIRNLNKTKQTIKKQNQPTKNTSKNRLKQCYNALGKEYSHSSPPIYAAKYSPGNFLLLRCWDRQRVPQNWVSERSEIFL